MFFGMTNSPATFQVIMNSIFDDLTNKPGSIGVIVYMDNILILAPTKSDLQKITTTVLQSFNAYKNITSTLKLKNANSVKLAWTF